MAQVALAILTWYVMTLDVVRYDTALCDLLGWKRGADHRAYQRYLNKFSQTVNQRVFGNLFRWFFSELKFDNYTLDFDSTVMVREGNPRMRKISGNTDTAAS